METVVSKRSGRKIGHRVRLRSHQAFIFRKKNGDASIDFADGKRYQHVGLGLRLISVCRSVFACLKSSN